MGHSINNTYNFIVSGYATGTFDAPIRLVARPYFTVHTDMQREFLMLLFNWWQGRILFRVHTHTFNGNGYALETT